MDETLGVARTLRGTEVLNQGGQSNTRTHPCIWGFISNQKLTYICCCFMNETCKPVESRPMLIPMQ